MHPSTHALRHAPPHTHTHSASSGKVFDTPARARRNPAHYISVRQPAAATSAHIHTDATASKRLRTKAAMARGPKGRPARRVWPPARPPPNQLAMLRHVRSTGLAYGARKDMPGHGAQTSRNPVEASSKLVEQSLTLVEPGPSLADIQPRVVYLCPT